MFHTILLIYNWIYNASQTSAMLQERQHLTLKTKQGSEIDLHSITALTEPQNSKCTQVITLSGHNQQRGILSCRNTTFSTASSPSMKTYQDTYHSTPPQQNIKIKLKTGCTFFVSADILNHSAGMSADISWWWLIRNVKDETGQSADLSINETLNVQHANLNSCNLMLV